MEVQKSEAFVALRNRAWEASSVARAIEKRIADGEDVSEEDLNMVGAAVDRAERLHRQADELQANLGRLGVFADRNDRIGRSMLESSTEELMYGDMPHIDRANTRSGKHGYSLLRAYRGAVALREGGGFGGLEAEVHQELLRERGATPTRGLLIPWDLTVPVARRHLPRDWRYRDLTTITGSGAIPDVLFLPMIELLRARLVLVGLGATIMPGMTSSFGIPRHSAASTGYWVAEGVTPTASNAQIDQVEFLPRTAGANTKLTRKFINQSSVIADAFAINDLVGAIADTLERAALNGSGTGAEPRGVLQTSGISTVTGLGANGGPMTWAKLMEFLGKIGSANAPLDTRAWLVNPQTRAKFGATPREAGYPKYLYDVDTPESPIAGFPVAETTNLPANFIKASSGAVLSAAIFGAWSEMVIALFSAIDIVVDPFTESTAGNVRISAFQDCDVKLRHPESFVVCTEIATA